MLFISLNINLLLMHGVIYYTEVAKVTNSYCISCLPLVVHYAGTMQANNWSQARYLQEDQLFLTARAYRLPLLELG